MQDYYRSAMQPDSSLMQQGVIPRMQPRFICCDFEKGTAETAYDGMEWEMNPSGLVHGGITSTALDTSMGMLAHYYMQKMVVTVTFNISFLKPIPIDSTFRIRCKLDSLGRTLATITAEVYLEDSELLAGICSATFMGVNS
jgi:uncharacterized protein (TIGR00369 family)